MYHLRQIEEKLHFAHTVYLRMNILTVYRLFPLDALIDWSV